MTHFQQFRTREDYQDHLKEETNQLLNSIKQLLLAILIALVLIVLGIWLPALLVL